MDHPMAAFWFALFVILTDKDCDGEEETDHDHLGKLITYASGKAADLVIWLVRKARPEHKAAIEWLNNHTDEGAK